MGKVVLKMIISVDGFVATKSGEIDWIYANFGDDYEEWEVAGLWQANVHIIGGKAAQVMAPHWMTSEEQYAPPMNETPKVIFSKTLERIDWHNARIERGDMATEVARLKAKTDKDVLAHGGADFAQSLTKLGLVDEYRLLVHPVALGEGMPFFPPVAEPLGLKTVEARLFKSGVVLHVYHPA